MLVSGVQQSDSVIYLYLSIYMFFFIFFSIVAYHRILNTAALVIYLFYVQ